MFNPEVHGVQFIAATDRDEGQRLDNCLFRLFKSLPKSHIYRLIRKGEVRVNKKRVDPEYRLIIGDQIRIPPVHLEKKSALPMLETAKFEWILQSILKETEEWLVLNKPCGLSVHAGTDTRYGVIETLRQARPDLKFVELAHRLDRDTSGCLLIAKKTSSLKIFHHMLREREAIQKTYRVLVKGCWPARLNRINAPVEGKDSLTTFQVLRHHDHNALTELAAVLHTGRQHQIRIHCQSAGFNIVGDTKYGHFAFNREFAKKTGQHRMFLHAEKLVFQWKGEKCSVVAPLDQSWIFV